ncbi:DUF4160 domain-containing protein [Rhizobium sp. BK068]|uniref:DUF4160 domain-containing protein n=1 Tax=Rhizobium sp. BK068 TaxID=2512130 RepID=UPI0010480D64|nr:DUF4160 domain-containing protein [Rhizobium sp. BK068]
MPTVLNFAGLGAVIYPNDHRPAHVHVIGNDCSAVFIMNCPDGSPELRENRGFGKPELGRIARSLNDARKGICEAWSRIHGDF